MKKKDIKNGAVVELRNGERYLKVDNTLLNLKMDGSSVLLNIYDKDLTFSRNKYFDIMKILNPKFNNLYPESCDLALSNIAEGNFEWTWEREKPKELLTNKEKAYLRSVMKPFKDYVKDLYFGYQGIRINIQIIEINKYPWSDSLLLPDYSVLKLDFKNCDRDKTYTLEKLGL